jgi:predicted ABC-type ATPase
MTAVPKPAQRPEPEPKPGVEVDDELYVHHAGQPCTGRVVCHGKHGVTVDIGGQHHPVRWDRVLGHKRRAALHGDVIDQGEDGMIVQDTRGRRRFISVPNDAKEDPFVAKSFGQRPVLLFMKSGPLANRPGLAQKEITDKRGVVSKRWVRSNPDQPKGRKRGDGDPPEAGAQHGYGTHNLSAGDRVHFAAGEFKGTGTIVGTPGRAGAHVKDASGRVHKVLWSEVTGHEPGEGAAKPPVKQEVRGSHEPVQPDAFKASDYAAQHDDAAVTPEAILSNFPPDTMDKIKAVQERLASIEQTVDKHKQGDNYHAERQAVHREIYQHFLSPERIQAATPAAGEKPTFTILGGRGGSGKSWFAGKVYDPNKAIVLDADEIKGMLPEYEGWNAAQVHEESSDIMNAVLGSARAMGLNVVLDGTLATKKSALQKVGAFKDDNYRVEAHYMHLPRQEAAKRAVQRFLGKTNRYVPVDVVLANRENETNFDEVRKLADAWSFRDNNVPQGQEPKLISQSGNNPDKKEGSTALTKSDQDPMIVLWRT